jgi:hypothetical protein
MSKPSQAEQQYWESVYNDLYDTYWQELLSEELMNFWSRFDTVSTVLVAVTASGSTIAGWALWNEPAGKVTWGIISGIAALVSVVSGALRVSTRIKEQGDLRSSFIHLRVQLEDFCRSLSRIEIGEAKARYESLHAQFEANMDKTHPDILVTDGSRKKLDARLNEIMVRKGYIQG